MIKIEEIRATGIRDFPAQGRTVPSNVVPITKKDGFRLFPEANPRRFALGRKGRRARLRSRLLEAAFITAATGTAALLWWASQ